MACAGQQFGCGSVLCLVTDVLHCSRPGAASSVFKISGIVLPVALQIPIALVHCCLLVCQEQSQKVYSIARKTLHKA